MTPQRVTYALLDSWRGIASLAVVLFHAGGILQYHVPARKGMFPYTCTEYGWLGVEVFFVVSGFCIASAAVNATRRDKTVLPFLLARVRRIYPPYLLALLLLGLSILGMQLLVHQGALAGNGFTQVAVKGQSPLFFLSNLTLTQLAFKQPVLLSVAWTLCYEVAFYGVVGVALALVGLHRGPVPMLVVLHGLTLACLIWQGAIGKPLPFPLDMWPEFGLGVLVFDFLARPGVRAVQLWCGGGVLAAALVGIRSNAIVGMEQPLWLSAWVALGFSLLLVVLHRWDARLSPQPLVRALARLGLFSYSLYLTHTITVRVVLQLLERLHWDDARGWLPLLLGTVLTVGLAWGFYWVGERPFLRARRPEEKPA